MLTSLWIWIFAGLESSWGTRLIPSSVYTLHHHKRLKLPLEAQAGWSRCLDLYLLLLSTSSWTIFGNKKRSDVATLCSARLDDMNWHPFVSNYKPILHFPDLYWIRHAPNLDGPIWLFGASKTRPYHGSTRNMDICSPEKIITLSSSGQAPSPVKRVRTRTMEPMWWWRASEPMTPTHR